MPYSARKKGRHIKAKDLVPPSTGSRYSNKMVEKMTAEVLEEYGVTETEVSEVMTAWSDAIAELVIMGKGHSMSIPYIGRIQYDPISIRSEYIKLLPEWIRKVSFRTTRISTIEWMEIASNPERMTEIIKFFRIKGNRVKLEDIINTARYGTTYVEQTDFRSRAEQGLADDDTGVQEFDQEG